MKYSLLICSFILMLFSCKKAEKEALETVVSTKIVNFKTLTGVEDLLADTESVAVMVTRSIVLRDPLKIELSGTKEVKLMNFTLKTIRNIQVFVKLAGTGERVALLKIDSITPLVTFQLPLSIVDHEEQLYTESGQLITLAKQTDLSKAVFSVVVDDPFYKRLNAMKIPWRLNFRKSQEDVGNWYRMNPLHARESLVMFTNLAYLFSQESTQTGFMAYEGLTANDGTLLSEEKKSAVYRDILTRANIETGLVRNVSGLGGGNLVAVAEYVMMRHYNKNAEEVLVHELGHALGFGHSSNMTYASNSKAFHLAMRPLINKMLTDREYPYWDYRMLNTYNKYIDMTGDYLREGKKPNGDRHNPTKYEY
ncbi:hypothetical protein OQX61_02735 [Pedobacter sp. PLR]|uniref:hypothetical protein n=1 Tax=Pedobacter sp. PLR TaxID=2994465 RepID=UPI0022467C54|nr:hypothetical protein [Pedobacter sp. PLR]MCX2450177.1 hypothetical protein [Pedobacter sp. PLR]